MRSIYKYYIDGALVSCPIGWEKWEDSISIDRSLKGLLVQSDVTLEFSGAGYKLLKAREERGGQNELVNVRVDQLCSQAGDYSTIYNGIFFVNQIEFDLNQCIAKCKMQDNGYYSKIYKNKSLEAFIETGKSKNEVSISPVGRVYVKYVDPCTGIDPAGNLPTAWKVGDVLRFLVQFMSDGEVDFYSSLFDTGGYWEFLTMSMGRYIHVDGSVTGDDLGPSLSYEMLLRELNAKDDLWFYIDNSKVKPLLVIEQFDKLFTSKVIHKFTNVSRLSSSYDITQMYAKINFGSGAIKPKGNDCESGAYYEEVDFVGCKDETFTILGKSNIDSTLDLKGNWIVSPNIIQDIIVNNSTDHDDEFFFIDCKEEVTTTPFVRLQANQEDIFSFGWHIFNWRLLNNNVCDRYFRGIPNSIAKWIGADTGRFKAMNSAQSAIIATSPSSYYPVQFDNDYGMVAGQQCFDDLNSYGNGTTQGLPVSRANSRFTSASSGIFKVRASINIITSFSAKFRVKFRRYDLSGTFINEIFSPEKILYPGQGNIQFEGSFFMSIGDYIEVAIYYTSSSWVVDYASSFELIGYEKLSGIVNEFDNGLYPVKKITTEDSLSCDDFNKIASARFDKISVSNASGLVLAGNIDSIRFNRLEGTAKINLMTTYK